MSLLTIQVPKQAEAATTLPTRMNFQGKLTDASGAIKPNGTYNMQLRLYTVASAGSSVWSENRLVSNGTGVQVTNGMFSIALGTVVAMPDSLYGAGTLYLEVQLPTPASATSASPVWSEPAMTPRNQMATTAYAFNTDLLDGQDGAYMLDAANKTGTLAVARLSGNYGNITGTGALSNAAGSIGGSFGSIATSNTIQGTRLISSVSTGTAPLAVTSTTKVANLNIDTLDGMDSTQFANASGSTSYIQNSTSPQTSNFAITGNGAVGSLSVGGNLMLTMPSNNPERGAFNPIWTGIGAGKSLYGDEEFRSGNNSISVYNNSGGSGVTITRLTGQTGVPNSSNNMLRVSYDGVGATSPDFGGVIQPINPVANKTYVQRFKAKVPVGKFLNIQENSQGTNATSYWLTNNAGTGKWEDYLRVSHAGNTGSFVLGGHLSVSGGTGAFDWYIASMNVYEVDSAFYSAANTWQEVQTFSGSGTALSVTNNMTVGGVVTASQLTSTVSTGTAPLTVSSTTKVANLNADYLDGYDASNFVIKIETADNITTRTNSGFYETSTASIGEGYPQDSGDWYNLISNTHDNNTNYFAMQFAGNFRNSNDVYYRSTNNSGSTAWNRLWHDGNDGASSGADADTLDGLSSANFAPTSGSASYLQNTTSAQSANFNITGSATIGGTLDVTGSTTVGGELDITGGSGTNYYDTSLEVRTTSTPRLSFTWGAVSSQVGMDSSGLVRTFDAAGTSYRAFGAYSYEIQGTTVFDGSRNLTNAGTGSFNGAFNFTNTLTGNGKTAIETYDTWLRFNNGGAFTDGIYTGNGLFRTDGTLQAGGNGSSLNVASGGSFTLGTNTIFANTSGNVGIGTTSPNGTAKLTVSGSANTGIAATNASVVFNNAATSQQNVLSINVAGTNRSTMRADYLGNQVVNATGSGGMYLNYDSGSGGIILGNASSPNNFTTVGASSTNYAASYQAAYYYCPNGGTLSGTTCSYAATYNNGYYYCPYGSGYGPDQCTYTATYNNGYYYCNNGHTLNGTNCTYTAVAQTSYSCPNGGTLSGTTCSYAATGTTTYSCPNGGNLNGTTCQYPAQASQYCPDVADDAYTGGGTCRHNRGGYTTRATCEAAGFSWDARGCYGTHASSTQYTCPNGGSVVGTTCNYQATQGTTYTCQSGHTRSGTTCTYNAWGATGYTCPSGGTNSGGNGPGTCSYAAPYQSAYYTCPSGGSLSGTTCTYGASYQPAYYSCSSGHSLSGSTCSYNASYQSAYYYCSGSSVLSGSTCYDYVNQIIMKNTSGANRFAVDNGGRLKAFGTVTGGVGSPDYAENIGVTDRSIQAADVVAMDPNRPEWAIKASTPYSPKMLGVISTKPGFLTNASSVDEASFADQRPLALSGRVPVKATTGNGLIRQGDYLTSSTIPGVAMKATEPGAVLGVAMADFTGSGDTYVCGDGATCGSVLLFINPSATNPAVTPNAVFQGGAGRLSDLRVSGALIADDVNATNATIASLTVTGNLVARGTLTVVEKIETKTLVVGGHLVTKGDNVTAEKGGALGQDSTVSVNGTDTAGTVTISTGERPLTAGDLARILPKIPYANATVMLTAGNAQAEHLDLYYTSENGTFTIKSNVPLIGQKTYEINYIVVVQN